MTDHTAQDHPLRERRLRDRATGLGCVLRKARTRVQASPIFGTFMLVDPYSKTVVAHDSPEGFGLTLDEIKAALTEDAA